MKRRRSSWDRILGGSGVFPSPRVDAASEAETADAVALLEAPPVGEAELAELHEFMTCERFTRRADPEFRERLRGDLWWSLLVQRGGGTVPRA